MRIDTDSLVIFVFNDSRENAYRGVIVITLPSFFEN